MASPNGTPSPSPYTITVEQDVAGDHLGGLHHWGVYIEPALEYWDLKPSTPDGKYNGVVKGDHGYTKAETVRGYRWAAGVVARTALVIGARLAEEAVRHGCAGWRGDRYDEPRCGISSAYDIDRVMSVEESPVVFLNVPGDEVDQWVARIKDCARQIIKADQEPVEEEPEPEAEATQHEPFIPGTMPTPQPRGADQ